MDLGAALAPPLTAHGSDNDWGTKCDLIINPLGLGVCAIEDSTGCVVVAGSEAIAPSDGQVI